MANEAMEARTKFLEEAAHHYALSAPATSAHFMQQRELDTAPRSLSEPGNHSGAVCKACGSIRIPGRTTRTEITSESNLEPKEPKAKARRRARRRILGKQDKYVKINCLVCYRFETVPLGKSNCDRRGPQKETGSERVMSSREERISHSEVLPEPERPTTTNAGSKRRAKARKQGGLQAILEKSKASAPSLPGPGLNLLDLMKQD